MALGRAKSIGPPPISVGSLDIPISFMARSSTAARLSCTKASRSGLPMPAHSGASSRTTMWFASSQHQPHFAPLSGKTQGQMLRNYDLSKFRTLFLAGERLDPDTLRWAENLLRVPVIDH